MTEKSFKANLWTSLKITHKSTGRKRLTTKTQGMPQSEQESGREYEHQPTLKEERDASPPLLNKCSSLPCEGHCSSEGAGDEERMQFLQLVFQNSRVGQIRPSVLRSTAFLLQANESNPTAMSRRKDMSHSAQISIQAVSSRHLNEDHNPGERTIAQWRVQQDLVRHMENQLIQEKQRLHAMQLHLRLFEYISTHTEGTSGLWTPLAPNFPPLGEPDGKTEKANEAPVRQEHWHIPPPHLLPDFVSSVEYYKYANVRPPYTYAFLIRWSILEAPEKERTLNEIYNWFTRMFFFFRYNVPTWKNAVRHNLSLHKCFVRMDGRKGAVWTVDEKEFQKRKGQKINRSSYVLLSSLNQEHMKDYPLKWLTPFPHSPSHDPSDLSMTAADSQ
ncbi:forkhead box protein P3 isoform X5 [Triplophysa dalaica]|uniref:forkhead box protein P3 isoform X5 n=1 Tax=Triplophysa dalaica TaxID=1582913 RepID=UPI0024E03AA6|nr:forkhead box protein P3 isoform X5 [Triplophysa dalaica]